MIHNQHIINTSFWEHETYFNNIDLIVVGSGIVGLSAAISFKETFKKAKVLVLERGILPTGASTKNAGFACFGSISELASDIKKTSADLVFQTIEMRIKGLELLRKRIGDKAIDYKQLGGYELFDDSNRYESCVEDIEFFNKELYHFTKQKQTYRVDSNKIKKFGFQSIKGIIHNTQEGQIDTGKMMLSLSALALEKGVIILNTIAVKKIEDSLNRILLNTTIGNLQAKKVIIATNGFANELLNLKNIEPARAQVLITKAIPNLKIKGTFHYNDGFVYFRNINNRILLGGGRNLDIKKETTSEFELNMKIQNYLTDFLKQKILPNQHHEIDQRWTGIMGIGDEKMPIIQSVSKNIVCAVRMGGMGVSIGSLVGKLAVDKLIY
jgi:glycine/D-amino acid oxidase-like deaminating enzyme